VLGILEIGSHKLLAQGGFEPRSSLVARITGMSHLAPGSFITFLFLSVDLDHFS
jgi:hypothetical protein